MSKSGPKRSKSNTEFIAETEITILARSISINRVVDRIVRSSKALIIITLECGYGGISLSNAIGQCVQLENLTVCTCSLDFNQVKFGSELQKCVNLRSLTVAGYSCYNRKIESAKKDGTNADVFLTRMVTNPELRFITFRDTSMTIKAVTDFLCRCPNLISICVDQCIRVRPERVSFEGCVFGSLQCLVFDNNLIGDLGATALANVLPHCVNLTDLHVSGNLIGDTGAAALMAALPANLKQLNLSSNDITSVGVELAPWHRLADLDLSYNKITNDGASALAETLPTFKHLIILNLDDNAITDGGASAFIPVLPKCGKLEFVDLRGNFISREILDEIQTLLDRQPQHYAMVASTPWNRKRHTDFGKKINEVFAAFSLGWRKVIMTAGSSVPDADPEMIEETLSHLNCYGLTAADLQAIIAAGVVALEKLKSTGGKKSDEDRYLRKIEVHKSLYSRTGV